MAAVNPGHVVVELVKIVEVEPVAAILLREGREGVDRDRRDPRLARRKLTVAVVDDPEARQTKRLDVEARVGAVIERVVDRTVVTIPNLVDQIRVEDVDPRRTKVLVPTGDEVGEVRVVARGDPIGHVVEGISREDLVILADVMIDPPEDLRVVECPPLEAGVVDAHQRIGVDTLRLRPELHQLFCCR